MKPLLVLLISSVIALFALRIFTGAWDYLSAGNIALAVMLLFTAIGHFKYREGMTMMVPEYLPAKKQLVYLTGIMEICFGIGLIIPGSRRLAADLLILFLLLVLPANINAAQKSVDYQKANYQGYGLSYLWLRVPLQLFFIAWAAYFGMIMT
ncbi:MAG: hypothetical protein JST19_05570 [Bacteroidetes bacterium]|nr:hypothetical protein [Bacteroidota bacterium]